MDLQIFCSERYIALTVYENLEISRGFVGEVSYKGVGALGNRCNDLLAAECTRRNEGRQDTAVLIQVYTYKVYVVKSRCLKYGAGMNQDAEWDTR